MSLYTEALIFAAQKHDGQTRKDGCTPYIMHPIAVAEILRKAGFNEEYQAAGLLHDVLEDTETTVDELKEFGDEIVAAVMLLTRRPGQDEAEYVDAILKNEMAATVKSADKIHNLYDMTYGGREGEQKPEEMREFAREYVAKAKQYYYGKFCYAVNDAIGLAKTGTMWWNYQEAERPDYSADDMELFVKIDREREEKYRELYRQGIEKPDFENPDIKFFERNMQMYVTYGVTDGINVTEVPTWRLDRAGWLPTNFNLFAPEHYDDVYQCRREEFIEAVKYYIAQHPLYDFVNERLY